MVSDEELERHVERVESARHDARDLGAEAREVHDELARRIEQTRENAADADDLAGLAERVAEIERRLDSLEERLR